MPKKFLVALFFCLIIIIPAVVFAATSEENILVKFNDSKNITEVSKEYGLNADEVKKIDRLDVFKIKNLSWDKKLKAYWNKYIAKKIDYIEPDYEYKALLVPDDTLYSSQWALPKISAPEAWDETIGTDTVTIAIVDTGISGTHEDLSGKVMEGYDFIHDAVLMPDANSDDHGHGTLVSGIAAAKTDNNLGISGLNWQAKLMPVKVLDNLGRGTASVISEGIIYAADHGAEILNLSFGGADISETMEAAIDYAHDEKGCVIIAASGNDNSGVDQPAKYSKVVAVGATNNADERCTPSNCGFGSNYGPELDLVAPGYLIFTTSNDGSYTSVYSGTSLAAPHVSGLAALIWSKSDLYTNAEVENLLKNSVDKVSGMDGSNFTNFYGFGRINAAKTLKNYHYEWKSQNSYPTLAPGQSYDFNVTLKNTGTDVWEKNIIRLGTDRPQDRTPVFTRGAGWVSANRIELPSDSLAPGEEITIPFRMTVPLDMKEGTYREYFRLVADGIGWLEDYGIYWDIIVKKPYNSSWISQNANPILGHGQSYQFEVTLKNSGLETWLPNIVRLGTSNPLDRTPVFARGDGWVSENRIQLTDVSVPADQNTILRFKYSVPNALAPGTYREYFRPVADGIAWLNDQGIYWDIKVLSDADAYSSAWQDQSEFAEHHPGDSISLFVKFKNKGLATWKGDNIRLGTSNPLDRTPIFERGAGWVSENRVSLKESSVSPGEIGTFEFSYTIPADITAGVYREYFRPVADGVKWMEDQGVYLDIIVQ